jgi:arginase
MTLALHAADAPAIVIGGDCAVSAAAVAHVAGDDLALVWFDAHPDLNTPSTSPSGAFAGMVLASLIDDGTVDAGRVVVAGAREWDAAEDAYAAVKGVAAVTVEQLADAEAFAETVVATGASRVYVHIDLDVLDPAEFLGLLEPIPFGVGTAQLVAAVKALVARLPLAGATIASFAPESTASAVDDAPTILRLIAALRG